MADIKFESYDRLAEELYLKKHQATLEIIMNQESEDTTPTERIPVMQRIIDNPFLLLFIGVVFPTVFYILWGVMELVSIPLAK